MKIYHGSKQIVKEPRIKGSKIDNDYGPAFYLTMDLDSAHEWACRNGSVGFVNVYELNTDKVKVLDLTDKEQYSVLNWVAVLLHFRTLDSGFKKAFGARLEYIEKHYYIDVNQYDMVIGFRADDAYFRFPLDFVRGNLTLEQLEYAYKLGKLGVQYVLISDKAFSSLKYIKSIISDEKYVEHYFSSVKKATEQFDSLNKDEEGIRIIDIIRGHE